MSCTGVVFCLIVLAGTTLAYTGLATHPARMGADTAIPCTFDADTIPSAQRTFTVTWLFQGKEIFRYPLALTSSDPRLSIDPSRVKDGIADLFLSAVTISDGGLYKCFMVHTSGRMEKEIRLDIQASPKISITNRTVAINQESVLRSTISGFYPVDVGVKWFREEKTLDNVIVERPQRLPDGTYIVNSSVTVTPTEKDRGRTFSCRVQHESITYALQENFRLQTDEEDVSWTTIIIAGAAGGGVLFTVILIIVIIVCKRKSPKRNKEEEILSNEKEPLNEISDMKTEEDSEIEKMKSKTVSKQEEALNTSPDVTRSTPIRTFKGGSMYNSGGVHPEERTSQQDSHNNYCEDTTPPNKQNNRYGGRIGEGNTPLTIGTKPAASDKYKARSYGEDTPKDMKSKEDSHNTDEIENKEIKEVGKHGEDSNKASNVTRSTSIARSVRSPGHKIIDESLEYTSETRRDKKGLLRENSDHMAQDNKVDVKSRVKMFTDLEKSVKENGGFQNPAAGKSLKIPGQQYQRKPPPSGS